MIQLPPHLYKQFQAYCADSCVQNGNFPDYLKWLRYFLDFCEKYRITGDGPERTRQFLEKLRQKGQSEDKRQQAARAVELYFAMIRTGVEAATPKQVIPAAPRQPSAEATSHCRPSQYNVAGYQETSDSPEWDEIDSSVSLTGENFELQRRRGCRLAAPSSFCQC